MCVALFPIAVDACRKRQGAMDLLSNVATFATFPLAGGLLARAVGVADLSDGAMAAAVLAIFMVVNLLNFLLVYGYHVMTQGWGWLAGIREMYAPVLPAQLAIGALTVAVAYAERYLGPSAIVVFAPNVLIFQWLLRTAIAAFERGRELEERNRELAALQFGLISSMLRTLALRDNMTARHSAAVARYARAMAVELGLDEKEQELIHTAALFHDIGKFIFPDSILLSKRKLTEEEYGIVRRHPEVGAEVIAGIEGYDDVAQIVLHHHERIDGRGYPHGLRGDEIPLGARMIAVADTYDVITARDTYQDPRPVPEAFAELRRVAGSQLDAQLVELFITLMTERGVVFRHAVAEDFEAELALERRVRDYANPKQAA
jgi:putative nucleotidyltransferase with HDIG domain